jgi:PiT family inorganic phosphate transporter
MEPILILTIFASLYMAWSIGGNDVANSMGTSVGSKCLTLKQAIVIASIANFSGAVLMGSHVTETVRKGIVKPEAFTANPTLLILGMLASLLAAGAWVQIATHLSLPVSTTHAVVGAVWGFGIISVGMGNIHWGKIFQIVLSWFISPFLGGLISFILFKWIRNKVLNKENPYKAAQKLSPFLLALVATIIALLTIYKGLKNLPFRLNFIEALGISLLFGCLLGLISVPFWNRVGSGKENYEATESIFAILQIVTASYMAFSHGANDVANAIGPAAAIYSISKSGVVGVKIPVPIWILALGGIGIALGISTFGYKVIKTVGEKITEVTPSRGFSAEFGAATTILFASKLGLPVSTTHCIVGAVIGVGLARGLTALNLNAIKNIIGSWLLTLPASGLLSSIIYIILTKLF